MFIIKINKINVKRRGILCEGTSLIELDKAGRWFSSLAQFHNQVCLILTSPKGWLKNCASRECLNTACWWINQKPRNNVHKMTLKKCLSMKFDRPISISNVWSSQTKLCCQFDLLGSCQPTVITAAKSEIHNAFLSLVYSVTFYTEKQLQHTFF